LPGKNKKFALQTKSCSDLRNKKGRVHLITGHEGPEYVYRYIFTLSLTSALDGDG
jgi:hypothetical protein